MLRWYETRRGTEISSGRRWWVRADWPRRARVRRGLILEGADEGKVRRVENEARSRTPYSERETEMRDDGLR
jgi:hypothetical protein